MFKISYINCDGDEITRLYDSPKDFVNEIDSDVFDAPMLDYVVTDVITLHFDSNITVEDVYNKIKEMFFNV